MVHVADESVYGKGYREINQQLAKENNDLRQQLGQALHEVCQQQTEIHKKDVEIVHLKSQLSQLKNVRERYKKIKDIISRESVCEESVATNKENDLSQLRNCLTDPELCFMTPIHETTENEEIQDSEGGRNQDQNEISETNDSLVPPEVTSVPPVDYCERTMQTPSIWNCLDTLGSPSSFPDETHHNNDNLHSTPVHPLKASKKKMPESETPKNKTSEPEAPRDEAPKPESNKEKEHEPEEPSRRYNLRKRTKR